MILELYEVMWPRIEVEVGEALIGANDLSVSFEVKNNGRYAIRDVAFECRVANISTDGHLRITMHNIRTTVAGSVPIMEPGESLTRTCSLVGTAGEIGRPLLSTPGEVRLQQADLSVGIGFRPCLLPFGLVRLFERCDSTRFTGRRSDGRFRWTKQPMADRRSPEI